jgi:hypothetical protein
MFLVSQNRSRNYYRFCKIRYLIILGKNDYSYYVRYYYLYKKVISFTVPHVYDTVNMYPKKNMNYSRQYVNSF